MSKYKILFSFLILAVGLHGQEVLTLETVKSLASKNNLEVGLGKLSAQSAAMQVYRANAGLTPRIDWNLNTNGAYNKVNQEFIDGRTIDRYGRTFAPNTNITLGWTLYDGKKMQTRYEILKKQSEFAAIQAGQTEDNVVFAAMELFYTLSRQKELIKYLRSSLPYYEERLKITEERWKIGRGSKLDFLQSQNDHNTQKSAIQNEELNFINQKAMLNLMLNRPADQAFDIEEVARSTEEYAYETIFKGAVANSETLKLLDKNIEINKLSIRDLEGNDLPRIGLTTSLGYNFSTTNAGQILLSRNLGLNAGFSASWNLYDGGHNRKQIEIARQTTSILEAQKSWRCPESSQTSPLY
ncbi:MAG: TolC family protein [Saprospiraceae bacterium]|nr:TolC family protein [Saprospiraceae bacterium]